MKKILMFVSTLLLVAGVNAASVAWSAAGLKNYAGNAYQVFIIGQNGVESIETVTALLDAGTGDSASAYKFGEGIVGATGAANAAAPADKTIGVGTHTAFMVLFDNATASDAQSYVVISGKTGQTQPVEATTAMVTFGAANASTIVNNAGNWKATGVPEPTSGLLLLVGGALLALRRKQK